jgi:hypothetical protein
MAWCLIKKYADAFRKALKDGTIDPSKLVTMDSATRRAFLATYVGEENAQNVNSLFESKLLLKNQQAGMIRWAKKIVGITPTVKADLISRIERLDRVLNPAEGEQFLNDLASTRLKVEVTQEEAKKIYDLSKLNAELRAKIPDDSKIRSKERLEYGVANTTLKEYISKLKYESTKLTFKEQPARYVLDVLLNVIPNTSQALMTAYDNSLWGRQMNSLLVVPRYTRIWVRNFLKSWSNIAKTLRGMDMMTAARADVFSRPNALNGKYDADPTGYGLGVKSEEVFQSEIPAKIPFLGRLFTASQVAFNAGALTTRADTADLEIAAAETLGLNMLDKKNAAATGSMVTSITGRGNIGGAESVLRKMFWSPRMYAGQLNQLTAHAFDPKATSNTRIQAAKNLTSMVGVYTLIFLLAKLLDPDSIDEKEHLGQIKIWGKWVDITGGKAGWLRLIQKMADKWIKSKNDELGYKEDTAWDVLLNFATGKAAPTAGFLISMLRGKTYDGKPITLPDLVKERGLPISYSTYESLAVDPTAGSILGLLLLEGLGFNVQSWLEGNDTTKIIPTGEVIKYDNFLGMLDVYIRAFAIDREDAWNKVFSGQRIMQISPNNIIVVARDDDWDARKKEYAKKYGIDAEKIKEVREEHLVPIKGGGQDADSNRVMISKSLWTEFTKVDNAYIAARKAGKISKEEGEQLIVGYKKSRISGKTKPSQEEILKRLQ